MNYKKYLIIFLFLPFLFCSCLSKEPNKKREYIKISSQYPRYFEKADGSTWVPVMINCLVPSGEETRVWTTVESYFKNFSENGGNAVRVWLSSPFLEIEDTQMGQYNPVKLKRIDTVLELAGKYNLKVKFLIEHIRIIDPEMKIWYNRKVLSDKNGGAFQNIKDFINTPQGRKVYLDRVKVLAERYRDNDQIYAWEIWNEMDAVDVSDWYGFTSVMLDSVKKLLPNHLVNQTLGSVHSLAAEERYERLFTLPNNEYISVHRYLDPGTKWNQYDKVKKPADLIASDVVQFAYRDNLIKPVVLNETGAVEGNHAGPSNLYKIDTLGVLLHDLIFAPFFSGAAGSGQVWHWNDYVSKNNLWFHYKRFSNVIKGFDPVAEKSRPFYHEVDSVRIYGLKGQKNSLVWCRDARNNWITELQNGIKPEAKSNITINLKDLQNENCRSVQAYDPWKDEWTEVNIINGRITLPTFTRSIVIKLK